MTRLDPPKFIDIPHPWEQHMTHGELLKEIAGKCLELGYWWWIDRHSIRNRSGWVDMVILGRGHHWFVEAKSENGRRTQAQIALARKAQICGLRYRLVRPSSLELFLAELTEARFG